MRNFLKHVFSIDFLYVLLIAAETAAIIFLCFYIPSIMPVAAAFAGIWLFTLITAAAIVSRRSSPEINCAAVIMIIALPVAGAVIYLIATAKRKLRGEIKFTGARPENGIDSACFKACGICAMPYSRAEYFADGDEYFTQLFKEIEKAQKSVYLEYFIMCRGRIFSRLVSALAVANRNGAEIKIIIDGIGCAFKLGRKDLKKLKTAGAEIRIFHRLKPLPHSRLNLRDHRKIASIDGKVAFTGGINIADEYANTDSPYGYWKDVGAAVYGGAAIAFEAMFLSLWNGSYEAEAPQAESKKCLPFCDLPPNRPSFAEDAFVYAVSSAKEKIHILTPYFCVSEKIHSALRLAAMRGVDVRIILPHIPDKKYALELSRACAERLMPAGVKFYEYTPGFMHAKVMTCDDGAYIGSYNFDHRSMRLNCECGLMIRGEVAMSAERDFWQCLRMSSPMKATKISFPRKAVRFILKIAAPLM